MAKRPRPSHDPIDFDLDVTLGDDDMFRWFLLCYLFGKPIQSGVAVKTWQLFIERKLDNPWAIIALEERKLTRVLRAGGYARYEHVTARGMLTCMDQLIRAYEGSLWLMYESSLNEEEFSKRLQTLYGVGPKTAEIFMRGTEELFARRME